MKSQFTRAIQFLPFYFYELCTDNSALIGKIADLQKEIAQLSARSDAPKIYELTGQVGKLEGRIDRLVQQLGDSHNDYSVLTDKIDALQKNVAAIPRLEQNQANSCDEDEGLAKK